jgi:transcriptional regulator with XRE-family HTH domain
MRSTDEWLAQAANLGEQLRALRKTARLTGDRLAADLGWPQSKVSKIETGRQMPTAEDITSWTRLCDASPKEAAELLRLQDEAQLTHSRWRVQMRSGQVAIQRRFSDLAAKATLIRNAETVYIPGLLQTPEYARARITEHAWLDRVADEPAATLETVAAEAGNEIEAATAERMRRQQILYEPGRRFEFIITEAALRFLLCPADVMLGQLDRLLAIAQGMPRVQLGVIPFGVPLRFTPQNGFLLFDDDLAVIESIGGETMLRGEETSVYVRAMSYLAAEACTGAQARDLLLDAIKALRTS